MNIFISHVSDEGLLALVLKEWIQTIFKNKIKVFVSSDIQNIAAGDKWLDNLGLALAHAKVLIVLCSPYSVTRPWVNFEIGGAWIKPIPIIPICHSGQKLDNLPSPLSSFQGLDIQSTEFPHVLIQGLLKRARLRQRPRFGPKSRQRMEKEIRSTIRGIRKTLSTRTTKPAQDKVSFILKKIATSNNKDCTCKKLSKLLNINQNDMDVYLRHLMDRKFIIKKAGNNRSYWYTTTEHGRNYLVQQNLLEK